MVAIAHPTTQPRHRTQPRQHGIELRLVPSSRPQRPDAATYARRRLAALLVLLAAVVALGLALGAVRPSAAAPVGTAPGAPLVVTDLAPYGAAGTEPPAGTRYVVQPGDTLWSIAAELHPGGDVQAAADRLAARNGGSALQVGQRLLVG